MSNPTSNTIILTRYYSIMGEVRLRDHRLSDVLNDKQETVIKMRNVTVSAYHQANKPPTHHPQAVVPKEEAIVVFEPPKQATAAAASGRLYGYVKKQAHEVFIILHDLEVKGHMFTAGTFDILDLHRMIAISGDKFYPVTQAVVTLPGGRVFNKPDGVLINGLHIHYLAKMESDTGRLVSEFARDRGKQQA